MTQQTTHAKLPPAAVFAALRVAAPIAHIGGGYETDVFRSGDGRYALKLKYVAGSTAMMLARARRLAQATDRFRAYLGTTHSLPCSYLIVASDGGQRHVLAVQPFLSDARALNALDLATLSPAHRDAIVQQLSAIVARVRTCYYATSTLPDLYGSSSRDSAQSRRWDPRWLARESWHLLFGRPLLVSHNLLLTADGRVVLIDCDPLGQHWLSGWLIHSARALLLLRDLRQFAELTLAQ